MEPAAVPALDLPGAVVRALVTGEQVAHLRRPGTSGLPAGATRFWLRPTGDEPVLKAAYRRARELSLPAEPAPPGQVRIEGWAELTGLATVRLDPERVAALSSKSVLDLEALAASLGDGEVEVLALRAHRLVEPRTVPEGLPGLPADPAQEASEPALSDVAFDARRKGLGDALPDGLPDEKEPDL